MFTGGLVYLFTLLLIIWPMGPVSIGMEVQLNTDGFTVMTLSFWTDKSAVLQLGFEKGRVLIQKRAFSARRDVLKRRQ